MLITGKRRRDLRSFLVLLLTICNNTTFELATVHNLDIVRTPSRR